MTPEQLMLMYTVWIVFGIIIIEWKVSIMCEMRKCKECKYNSSPNNNQFVGYCQLPKYYNERGQRLVECKGWPCDEFEKSEGGV